MACPLPPDQLKSLKLFIDFCKMEPGILHLNELSFFKAYIESLGGVIPPKKVAEEKFHGAKAPQPEESSSEEESEESEVELDYEGVIEPDSDHELVVGCDEKEVTEEDMDKADEKKREAMDFYRQEKYEDAIKSYTEAILLNPRAAVLYAKRGQCYLQLMKPNACIKDCTKALEINSDNASAYKFRGRAHRLLGNFLKSVEDLRTACKIDFDEQANEWLKEVTPNVYKLEEHRRKYERKQIEKELKKTRERINKMKERQKAKTDEPESGNDASGKESVNVDDFESIMNAMKDPEVMEAFLDMSKDPRNVLKYHKNPKVNGIIRKWMEVLNGKVPNTGGNFMTEELLKAMMQAQTGEAPKQAGEAPKQAADVDLD